MFTPPQDEHERLIRAILKASPPMQNADKHANYLGTLTVRELSERLKIITSQSGSFHRRGWSPATQTV